MGSKSDYLLEPFWRIILQRVCLVARLLCSWCCWGCYQSAGSPSAASYTSRSSFAPSALFPFPSAFPDIGSCWEGHSPRTSRCLVRCCQARHWPVLSSWGKVLTARHWWTSAVENVWIDDALVSYSCLLAPIRPEWLQGYLTNESVDSGIIPFQQPWLDLRVIFLKPFLLFLLWFFLEVGFFLLLLGQTQTEHQ